MTTFAVSLAEPGTCTSSLLARWDLLFSWVAGGTGCDQTVVYEDIKIDDGYGAAFIVEA